MALSGLRNAIMYWNGTKVTDHNRSALSVDVERIESKQRMADGTLRKYVIADKRTFSCSWDDLPSLTGQTVDGGMGAAAIEAFYLANQGAFTLVLYNNTNTIAGTYTVMFSEYSKTIKKRYAGTELWSVDVSLEEV
jgi:hypothetical protein